MISVAILGTIGVGKTTLLYNLKQVLQKDNKVIVKDEPSVSIPFINEILSKFYNNGDKWAYPLQLSISAAQEAFFQELRDTSGEYDIALVDMPYSSDIYGYSHYKNGRITESEFNSLLQLGSGYPFDVVVLLSEDKDVTIERVKKRNTAVNNGTNSDDRSDLEIADFSYLDKHIEEFKEYEDAWIGKFKKFNPAVRVIKINHIPDVSDQEYSDLIDNIKTEILE